MDFDIEEFNDFMDAANRFGQDASQDANATLQQFMKDGQLEFLNGNASAEIDANGHLQVTTPDGTYDFTEVSQDFSEGNFSDGFDKLDYNVNNPDVKAEIDRLNAAQEATPNAQLKSVQDDLNSSGKAIQDKLKGQVPVDDADLAAKADQVDKKAGDQVRQESAEFKDSKPSDDDIEEYKKTGDDSVFKKFKDWLCKPRESITGLASKGLCFLLQNFFTLAFLAVLAWLAIDLVDFIKHVGASLSGCWSYIGSDQSCKILPLTCNADDRDTSTPSWLVISGKNFAPCEPCPDYPGSTACNSKTSNNLWIPVRTSQMCSCSGQANFLAGYNGDNFNANYTSNNTCQGCTGPAPAPGLTPACPNAAGCVAWNEACQNPMNSDCSSWCDSSIIKTRPNQSISCKQCDFFCAMAATIGDIFSLPSDLLGTIEKILLWVALGIVILVVGYIALRFIFRMLSGEKSERKKDKKTDNDTTTTETTAETTKKDSKKDSGTTKKDSKKDSGTTKKDPPVRKTKKA